MLASSSPRRVDLLTQYSVPFAQLPPSVKESAPEYLSPKEIVCQNAWIKAHAVAVKKPGHTIVAVDTLVELDGQVLGKPESAAHAEEMLQALSGRRHGVWSGLAVFGAKSQAWSLHACYSLVKLRPMSRTMIRRYIAEGDILDKAGAYALQSQQPFAIAEWVEGSVTNVIGLPMECLARMLNTLGENEAS